MPELVRLTIFDGIIERSAKALSRNDRREVAAEIAADARSQAPVVTGAYRDGISVADIGGEPAVVDDDPDAIYKEYGTVDTPAHAALTDAARHHGKYSGWQPHGSRR